MSYKKFGARSKISLLATLIMILLGVNSMSAFKNTWELDEDGYLHYDFLQDGLFYTFVEDGNDEVWVKAAHTGVLAYMPAETRAFFDEIPYREEVIERYIDNDGTLHIPATVTYNDKTYTVIGIDYCGFIGMSEIKHIVFPETLRFIEDSAFEGCINLEDITLPENIQGIGMFAFSESNVAEVTIPEKCTNLRDAIFSGCVNLKKIEVEGQLTYIPSSFCRGCRNLEEVVIPETVKSLGYAAFGNCIKLDYDIPEHITKIGYGCFEGNNLVKQIEIPETVLDFDYSAFANCDKLWSLSVNRSYKVIMLSRPTDLCSPIQNNYLIMDEAYPYELNVEFLTLNTTEVQKSLDLFLNVGDEKKTILVVPKEVRDEYMAEYAENLLQNAVSVDVKSNSEDMQFIINPCDEDMMLNAEYFAELKPQSSLLMDKVQSVVVGWKVNNNNISEIPYLNGVELTDITYQNGIALVKLEGLTKNSVLEVKAINAAVDMVAESAEYEIFSLDGIRIYKGADDAVKQSLPKGIYIVKQNGNTTKIVK